MRVTPDVRGETHEKISTGQADSKFGFSMADAARGDRAGPGSPASRCEGLHAHIGSQLLELEPFRREAAELAALGDAFRSGTSAAGSASQYTDEQPARPRSRTTSGALVGAARGGIPPEGRLLIEPGRALCANAAVTLYTVESVKQNVSRWVAVDGGMSDNLRPMLYGAALRSPAGRPLRRLDRVRPGRQALRVRRRDRPRRPARGPPARATSSSRRRPAPTASRWPTTTTASRAAGDLLPRRRRARGRPARELRGSDGARCPLASAAARRRRLRKAAFRVGLLGHGNVGGAFAALLDERADEIERMNGRRPVLSGVLTRTRGRLRGDPRGLGAARRGHRRDRTGPRIPAAAMRAGRHVVTANKQLLSQHGEELFEAAREHDVRLRFEAAVAGVVPVVRVLEESLAGAHIERIHGIVNGTTNFILTEMARRLELRRGAGRGPAQRLRRGRPHRRRQRPRRRRQDGDPGAPRLRHARAPRRGPLRGHRAPPDRRPRSTPASSASASS